MSIQSRTYSVGSAHVATSIYGMRKKIETSNSVNRQKRRLLHVCKTDRFFLKWQLLTASSPPPQILPSGAWGEGETKMAPYDNGALVQLTSNESTDSVGKELSLSVQ